MPDLRKSCLLLALCASFLVAYGSPLLAKDSGRVTLVCTQTDNQNNSKAWVVDYDESTVTYVGGSTVSATITDDEIDWVLHGEWEYHLDRNTGLLRERNRYSNMTYRCEIQKKKI